MEELFEEFLNKKISKEILGVCRRNFFGRFYGGISGQIFGSISDEFLEDFPKESLEKL